MPVANPTPGRRQVDSWCTTIDGPTGWMEFQAVRGIGKTKTVGEHDSTQGLAQRRSWANSITEREYHWLQDFCLKLAGETSGRLLSPNCNLVLTCAGNGPARRRN